MAKDKIAIARGDGIGPEIMDAVLGILKAAGADLETEEVVVGEKAYDAGETLGISDEDFEKLKNCRAFLKAPLNTPQGKGYSSVNVAIRKRFDLFANVRPSMSLEPVLEAPNGKTDMVIIRENIEDLYAGNEYKPTPDTVVGRKVVTRSETERIIRMAFEYAKSNGIPLVTGIAKDNIQKFTDGLFHEMLDKVSQDYPDVETGFYIADIGIARLGARPSEFKAVVTQNMYGDIGSDVVGEALGSVGLSGSANMGENFAMFEAVHGTAPDIQGKGIANPSGLLMGAVMMLNYIGQNDVAEKVQNAWLKTLEDGVYTGDVYWRGRGFDAESSKIPMWLQKGLHYFEGDGQPAKQRVGTDDFAKAVIERLGRKPKILKPVDYSTKGQSLTMPTFTPPENAAEFVTVGADIDVNYVGNPKQLADKVEPLLEGLDAKLDEILTVRGDKVWPEPQDTFYTDCLTLRIAFADALEKGEEVKRQTTANIVSAFSQAGSDINWREVRVLSKNAATLDNNFR